MFGLLIGSVTSVFFGLYAYFLPFVLYAAWVTIALWDLARSGRGKGAVIGWSAVILLVPFLGVILYYVIGRSAIPAWQRWTTIDRAETEKGRSPGLISTCPSTS